MTDGNNARCPLCRRETASMERARTEEIQGQEPQILTALQVMRWMPSRDVGTTTNIFGHFSWWQVVDADGNRDPLGFFLHSKARLSGD